MPTGTYKRTEYHNAISRKNGFQKGNKPWHAGTKGIIKNGFQEGHPNFSGYRFPKGHKINLGKKSPETSERMTGKGNPMYGIVGGEHPNWAGDRVGYFTLHSWVMRWKGKPTTCEHCGKTGLTGMKIHWANKDHKYKRNLEDWIRLCASCHKIYDYKNHLADIGSGGGSIKNVIDYLIKWDI